MLAHYLARYDGGRYAKLLLEDDIHQINADKIGISRRQVKTVTYAFLYGAGDEKIGHSYDPQLSTTAAKKKERRFVQRMLTRLMDWMLYSKLLNKLQKEGSSSLSMDEKINVDSPHKALNYCLQSGAGVIAKRWMVINQETMREAQICASQLGFIHDELQFECAPEHIGDLSTSLVYSATAAGEYYNMRIRIDAEATNRNQLE